MPPLWPGAKFFVLVVVAYTRQRLHGKCLCFQRDCTLQSKVISPITLKVRGRMHGNEADPRTGLNVHEQQYAINGKADVSVKLSDLECFVGVSSTIPCSSKCFYIRVAREQ